MLHGNHFKVLRWAVGLPFILATATPAANAATTNTPSAIPSMDGVWQDFVMTQKPAGEGQLKVQLAVSGARVEPAPCGAQLVLQQSGRKIAYSRLHATDATSKELPARMEVIGSGVRPSSGAATSEAAYAPQQSTPSERLQLAAPGGGRTPTLAVLVNDTDAT